MGDVVIFFNFRGDRAKELTTVLTQQDMPEQGMTIIANLQYYCMTPYDDSFTGVHILFPKDNQENTLGEYIASMGLKQLHIAETANKNAKVQSGALADVAPSVLYIMGLQQPKEMTGQCLIME